MLLLFNVFSLLSSEETLPELGDASSSAISLSSEYKLGRFYMAQLRGTLPDLRDPIIQDYIEHMIYRISEYSQLEDRRLEIMLINNKNIRSK